MNGRRSALSKGDRRERALVRGAERMLADGEFAAASVEALAAEAGISRATFYFYFASKSALLSAVIAETVGQLESRFDAAADQQGTAAGAIASTVQAASELWRDHRVVLMSSVELGATMPEVYERSRASMTRVVELTLEILRRDGHPDARADAEGLERVVTALVLMSERNFYDFARRSAPDSTGEQNVEQLVTTLTEIWLRTLRLI